MADDNTAQLMTIDEVARAAGTTARNVRAYQERGLLAPPEKIGRTGYYDAAHLERLALISNLAERGFSLAAIAELLAAWEQGGTLGGVLGFERALATPYRTEEPVEIEVGWIDEQLPSDDPTVPDRAMAAGIIEVNDEGDLVAPSMGLLELAAALHREGVPVEALVDEAELLHDDLDRIAARFHQMFEDHVWRPFAERGAPSDELGTITAALDRVRPIPAAAVAIMLGQAMERRMPVVARSMLDDATHRRSSSSR